MELAKQIALDTIASFTLVFLLSLFIPPLWRVLPAALILGLLIVVSYHLLVFFGARRIRARERMGLDEEVS